MKIWAHWFGLLAIVTLFLLIFSHNNFASAASSDRPEVPRYGLFEVTFTCPDFTGNPFDPTVNDVWATLHGPKGSLRIPAFWDGNGVWKARIAPENVGWYKVTLSRNGIDETMNTVSPLQFYCDQSDSPGFIRVSSAKGNWPHFVFDNGTTYFPIGMDAAWGGSDVLPYEQLFPKMSSYQMNFARVWMTFWDGKALDWAPSKSDSPVPGVLILDSARRIDSILKSATSTGIYVQLTLQHHGQVTRVVDPNWDDSPFNVQNPGGFLKDPDQFFTDAHALSLTKAKFRYIIARYAWCSHLLGFELFNEVQNNPDLVEGDIENWHRTMLAYIRSVDPYHHLITTSYTDPSVKLAQVTTLDYYQQHAYPSDPGEYFRSKADFQSPVPIFWGEFGASGTQTQAVLHDGLWAGLMDSTAGAPEFWYWDMVQHNDWWSEFSNVTAFAKESGLSTTSDSAYVPTVVNTPSRGELTLVPGLGWATEVGDGNVTVTPDGKSTGMDGIPDFIQGTYHRTMMPHPLTINTSYARPTTIHVKISAVSQSGAHLQATVDGTDTADLDIAGGSKSFPLDLQVPVGPGPHAVQLLNTGLDHCTLDQIVIDNGAPGVDVMMRQISGGYVFWSNRTDYSHDTPISATFSFSDISGNAYRVTYYNTGTGAVDRENLVVTPKNHVVTVPLNLLGADVAGWLTPV